VNLKPATDLTDEQFWQIFTANRAPEFELSAVGELIIMSPTSGTIGNHNGRLKQQMFN
jgi:Uma2 family endonuclease